MTEHYQVVLRAEPHPIAPILRMRALLKRALRDHALKCTWISQVQPQPQRQQHMKISQEFNKYWRAEDIKAPVTLTISSTAVELLGEEKERNLVVAFEEDGRRLVAKPMRRNQLVALFGDDTVDWLGQKVELFTMEVWFGQKQVPSIQVRVPGGSGQTGKTSKTRRVPRGMPRPEDSARAAQEPLDDLLDDDISDI